jgi:hypothetical protein
MNHLRQDNTVGFNDVQLETLNNWINHRLEDAETIDPNYDEIVKATCKRALDFYQEILSESGIDYDE